MKVFFGVLIVLVVLTLAEGGNRKAVRAARKCKKMNKTFEGCLEKGYKSICDESDDDNEEEEVVVNHCPTDFPNVYYNGQYCCKSNMEKFYEPQGAQCDGSVIQRDSMCCAGDQYTSCPGGNCESNPAPTPDIPQCPASHPNVYYNGQHCCASNVEKVYAPQGAQCDGGVIGRDSMCCEGDQHTPCPSGNCASYQPSRSKRESEPEEAQLSKKESRKCARVEKNLMKKCDYEC
ncbi:uncharacterized protein LOC134818522 [Bolinopsis microptera]|uniref:uncharacterized protein LOC134818522 n=1 Tax=Bolinopsis microptera TaxID=2820187 RepID=UPI00307936D6